MVNGATMKSNIESAILEAIEGKRRRPQPLCIKKVELCGQGERGSQGSALSLLHRQLCQSPSGRQL